MLLSRVTIERFQRFRSLRRSWWSLVLLTVAYLLSLLSPWLVNDRPLWLQVDGRSYFPVLQFHAGTEFGLQQATEPDYTRLVADLQTQGIPVRAVFPPIPHDPLRSQLDQAGSPPFAPSSKHWLGTDAHGRDLLSRLVHGFRLCMSFAIVLALLSTLFGIVIGGIQGYLGGKVDLLVQRVIEVWSALPFLYVVILLGSIYGRGFALLLLMMAVFQWIGLSYYMRGEFLRLREVGWVRAARAAGLPGRHIFFREILPNALTPVVTLLPFQVVGGIGSLTALDFLGFGLQAPTPSWGELLSQGLVNLQAPWITISTVLALFFTLLLATFIGEGVREALDPRSGDRYE